MHSTRPVLLLILVPFAAFTAWCLAVGGSLPEVWGALTATPWNVQIGLDLCIALSLFCVWVWRDARERGRNPLPWVIATGLTGSIAPLAYLVVRASASEGDPQRSVSAA